jgi:hypothetical protein
VRGERLAGLDRFSQATRVTDWWALAVSPTFYFGLICFESKIHKKNPNLFKNKTRKIPKKQ